MPIHEDTIVNKRLGIISLGFFLAVAVICLRLIQVQVFKHGYYSLLASEEHLSKYKIPSSRGQIYLTDRGEPLPAVFNRNLKVLYADARYVQDSVAVARELASVTGGNAQKYEQLIERGGSYIVLEREVEPEVASRVKALGVGGIGLGDSAKRIYPEKTLAAHVLGFVNNDGAGQYGIEQQFNEFLAGQPGLLDAKTDIGGIPIATSDNVQIEPVEGGDVFLTIDRNLQAVVERVLKQGTEEYGAQSASAVVMDPRSGAVLALANYPTFEPENYSNTDFNRFINIAVNGQFEPGSGFKSFAMATGIDSGAVTPDTTYFDTGLEVIDGYSIKNAIGSGGLVRTMTNVITESVNTGVVFVLKQLGGGSINLQAKQTLFKYYTEHFRFGTRSGIELPNETAGQVPAPEAASDVAYANMTFGQGLTVNMVQMVQAYASVVNGGKLYKPFIVNELRASDGKSQITQPNVIDSSVISAETSRQLKSMMETVVESGGGYGTKLEGYRIGGKTGTAQIPSPGGGYYTDRDIGSFIGFAPFDTPSVVMMVRVDRPTRAPGFAGSAAAGPMFGEIMEWFLRYYGIPPDAR